MAYTTKVNTNNKTLFDLAIELYGNSSYVFKLIEDNAETIPTLQTPITVGMVISYDDAVVYEVATIADEVEVVTDPYKYITARENQSMFDMSLQLYGGVEDVFRIVEDNPELDNINNSYLSGVSLKYTPQTFAITEYFRTNSIYITTGANGTRQFDESFSWSFR